MGELGSLFAAEEETLRAARSIKSLEWKAIREERFHITPDALFNELCKNVEACIRRSAEEEKRKQEWLDAEGDEEQDESEVPAPGQRADRFGLDLDRFNNPGGKRPPDWSRAVSISGCAAIDEMRTLLELHYVTGGNIDSVVAA